MFVHYRTEAFILRKEDIGEADRLFTVYSKAFGRLELLAKAGRKIKSKLRGGLELFYLSELEFIQGKGYKTIIDAFLINNFKEIRNDLAKLSVAYKISETLDQLIRGQEQDEQVWNLIKKTFNELEINGKKPEIVYYYFFWNLVSLLGYKPEASHLKPDTRKIVEIIFKKDQRILDRLKVDEKQLKALKTASDYYLSVLN